MTASIISYSTLYAGNNISWKKICSTKMDFLRINILKCF